MSIRPLICHQCGAPLRMEENGAVMCEYCGTHYLVRPDRCDGSVVAPGTHTHALPGVRMHAISIPQHTHSIYLGGMYSAGMYASASQTFGQAGARLPTPCGIAG